ncbi:uncharacterized protein LOC135817807 [Sycon ciliatum]|uniref:uncharacterized protein LOC135817807 n=1 Tax=Sycon ciliatum TaxID=27933 RepID=UPI0031F64758
MTNPPFRPRTNAAKTPSYAASTADDRFSMFRGTQQAAAPPAAGLNGAKRFGSNAPPDRQRRWTGAGGESASGRSSQLPWLASAKPGNATVPPPSGRRIPSRHAPGASMGFTASQQQHATERFNRFSGNSRTGDCDLQFEVWNFASPAKASERPRSGSERAAPGRDVEESSPRAVSLPEVGSSGLTTVRLPPIVPGTSDGGGGDDEEDDDHFGENQDEDEDVVLDEQEQSDNSEEESSGDEEHGADKQASEGMSSEQADTKEQRTAPQRRRRRSIMLEFPSADNDFGLFPATIMQEHALIDARLAIAQHRTLRHLDPSSAGAELCAGIDNVVRSFAIRGPLDCKILEKAIGEEVAKCPLLRVIFYQYRDQLFCRAAKDPVRVHLEHELSGSTSEAIGDARRRPFHVHLYPIDREEVEREGLLVECTVAEAETSKSHMMRGRRLDKLPEESDGPLSARAGTAKKHGQRRNSALRGSGVNTFSSKMSIIDLDDVQVNTSTRARRIGSALKRRPWSSVIHISRGEGLDEIAEQQKATAAGPLSSRQVPSLLSVAGVGVESSTTNAFAESSSRLGPASESKRSMTSSQNELAERPSSEPSMVVLWLRAKVISTSTQEHLLVLSSPSFVSDYWSLSMLFMSICKAYTALERQHAGNDKRSAAGASKRMTRTRSTNSRMQSLPMHGAVMKSPSRMAGQSSIQDHYARHAPAKTAASSTTVAGSGVRFQEVAMREAELLQLRSRGKLWELWEAQSTLTVLTRQGQKKSKPAPVLQLPFHVRGETARRTALLKSARTRTGACSVGGTFTSFKFLKVDDYITELFQRNLPAAVWQRISADNPLFLMSLALFVVLMGRCCRGWDGGANNRAPLQNVSQTSSTRLGTLSEAAGGSQQRRPPSSRAQPSSRRYLNAAPPGAGYFLVGLPLQVRDLSPMQMSTIHGPMTNDVGLKVTLPAFKTFSDLLIGLDKSLKSIRKQIHFPFSSISDEIGVRGGLPVSFSFLRRREVQCLTNPEAFYFTETAVGVPGQGLARFGSQCYLQPEHGQLKEHCHLELLLWEMLENESVRGGFRFQPQLIRASLVEGLADQFCHLAGVVAENPSIALSDLAACMAPPFEHRRACERQPSAFKRNR